MNRQLLFQKVWWESPMPVLLEAFVLVVLAGALLEVVILNQMSLDVQYRIGLGITIFGLAWLTSYAVYKHQQPQSSPAEATKEKQPQSPTPPATSPELPKPEPPNPPKANKLANPNPPQVSPITPDPLVRIEPEEGTVSAQQEQEGLFKLTLQNDGVDIDHIDGKQDYFFAEKTGGTVRINRLAEAIDLFSPPMPSLRTNQSLPIPVNFNLVKSTVRGLGKFGYNGLVGVRIRIAFRRYSDQKGFRVIKAYWAIGQSLSDPGGFNGLLAPEENNIRQSPDVFRFSEVLPYMNSDDHWRDPWFRSQGDGKIEMIDRIPSTPKSN
jgi:hypothetical protein